MSVYLDKHEKGISNTQNNLYIGVFIFNHLFELIVEWYNFPLHVPLIIFQPHRYNSAHLTLNCNEFVNDTVSIEWLIATWISCTIRWATHRTALHFFQEKGQILPCFFLWVLIFFLSCWFLYNGCENKDLNQTKSFEKGRELSIHKTLHFFSI